MYLCKEAFVKILPPRNNITEAELKNLKSKGKLIHANIMFFKSICSVENSFIKNTNNS